MVKILEEIIDVVSSEGKMIVGITVGSYLLGLTTGAIGKTIGGEWKYVAPSTLPTMDLIMGKISPSIIPYSLGVLTNYIV